MGIHQKYLAILLGGWGLLFLGGTWLRSHAQANIPAEAVADFWGHIAKGEADGVRQQLATYPSLAKLSGPDGRDSLQAAVEADCRACLKALLAQGVGPERLAGKDQSLLMLAASTGRSWAVYELLRAGADVNRIVDGQPLTAVDWARRSRLGAESLVVLRAAGGLSYRELQAGAR